MRIDRRRALGLLGAAAPAAGLALAARSSTPAFAYGVASGDPGPESVILWTRLSGVSADTPVKWTVAEDEGFTRVAADGGAVAVADRDFTIKVEARGLKPGRSYFYRFSTAQGLSPVGRTRTLPARGSAEPVVLAVASCALHPNGFFNAYKAIAELERVDAVVHLGDYIYEYGAEPTAYGMRNGARLGRIPIPAHELVSLTDYRARHAQYKAEPELQAAHARAAWIVVVDDHETANNAWLGGAQNHNETEGEWAARKAAALRAYFEWMPIREPRQGAMREAMNRSFRFGDVASLHMVETRLLARSEPLDYDTDLPVTDGKPDVAALTRKMQDPGRRLLGDEQLRDLGHAVRTSVGEGVTWQVIGNQVVMARVAGPDVVKALGESAVKAALAAAEGRPRQRLEQMVRLFPHGLPLNLDAWDGYPAERERLYALFREAKARPIVLAGDSHTAWVNELHDKDGQRVAIEFGVTAVSSPPPSYDSIPGVDVKPVIREQNPEVIHMDTHRGFTLLTLTKEEARAALVWVSTIESREFTTRIDKRFRARPEPAGVSSVEAL